MENIKLHGTKNTRDFGGIKNKDNKEIRTKCFLRSACLDEINDKDVKKLKTEFNLKTIIDLRTDTEISEKPDIVIDGVEHIHIPVFNEETAGITHEKDADKSEILANLPDMCELYRTIVSDEHCVKQLRKVFDVITTAPNTVLWHCTEGKDRCGIVSALFLTMLDVDREAIYQDYLLTNSASSKNAKKYYRLVRYLMRNKEKALEIKRIFSAEKEFLDAAFEEMECTSSTVENYLREQIGISDETKEEMKRKYLV